MARIAERLARGSTISFEFFPPKTAGAQLTLGRTVAALEPLQPDFVSVTYGAGGSDRHRTGDVVTWMRRETGLEPMAHLTCVGHRRDEVASLLVEYRRMGVENILALGGDPPKDGDAAGDYRYASDLIADVAAPGCFSVGVAAHPEVHPRSPDRASDRRHLADKLASADFAITQFFFDVEHYVRLVDELADLGVDKPIVPGVMPIANLAPIERMAAMNGTEIPGWVRDRVAAANDPNEVAHVGTEIAIELAGQVLDAGAPGVHLYTLNRPDAAQHVCAALDLRPD